MNNQNLKTKDDYLEAIATEMIKEFKKKGVSIEHGIVKEILNSDTVFNSMYIECDVNGCQTTNWHGNPPG